MLRCLVACWVLGGVSSLAHAIPVKYEFSTQVDDISFNAFAEDIPSGLADKFLALRGTPIVGSFFYDSSVTPLFSNPSFGALYPNAISGYTVNVGGVEVSGAGVGSSVVHSTDQDRFSLSSGPIGSGSILGYTVVGSNLAWVEGVPPSVPSFLTSDALPALLPTAFFAQFFVSVNVPELPPAIPVLGPRATLGSLTTTVRLVAIPEPPAVALLAAGWIVLAGLRRGRPFAAAAAR